MSDREDIPFIVTTDVSTPRLNVVSGEDNVPSRNRSPVDDGFLSPQTAGGAGRTSLDVPGSPSPSEFSSNDGSISVPPSPTLSNRSSVHFNTTLALRDNKPESRTGMTSLSLLGPVDQSNSQTHHRKGSNATFTSSSEGTEADHRTDVDLQHVKSNTTSITHVEPSRTSITHVEPSRTKRGTTDSDTATAVSEKRKKKKKSGEEEIPDHSRSELSQDADVDPTPFAFKPYELAQMLDPKNLELLESLGGTQGLIRGLGTNATRGLGKQSLMRTATVDAGDEKNPGDGRPGAGGDGSQRHDPEKSEATTHAPAIVLTAPEGEGGSPLEGNDADEDGPAFTASLNERRKIYGRNVLPQRPSKTLLQLMWAALKDKVLV
jgi:Ca2+-transporting ATPase